MVHGPVILDTDVLSDLSRGNLRVRKHAAEYLENFGRLTITAITVFERLRGYRLALKDGRPVSRHMQGFVALTSQCVVLPFDQNAAFVAAEIWSSVFRKHRRMIGDILIASVAISRGMPLVTRNRRDFERLGAASASELRLLDWS